MLQKAKNHDAKGIESHLLPRRLHLPLLPVIVARARNTPPLQHRPTKRRVHKRPHDVEETVVQDVQQSGKEQNHSDRELHSPALV